MMKAEDLVFKWEGEFKQKRRNPTRPKTSLIDENASAVGENIAEIKFVKPNDVALNFNAITSNYWDGGKMIL